MSQTADTFRPRGVLIAAESISGDGEREGYHEVIVTLEQNSKGEPSLDIRLGDKKGTIVMVAVAQVEGALRLLTADGSEESR